MLSKLRECGYMNCIRSIDDYYVVLYIVIPLKVVVAVEISKCTLVQRDAFSN